MKIKHAFPHKILGAALLWMSLGVVPWLTPQLQAEVLTNSVVPPLQVMQDLLSSTNVIWDAESKTTNVVAEAGNAEFLFCFTNVSSASLNVISVRTSCGCTTAQLPVLPWKLLPRASGQIGVRVDLAGKSGTLLKTITVGTDQGTKTLMVKIIIAPPTKLATSDATRGQNLLVSQGNRQAVFKADCARCHIKSIEGKYAKELYDSVCGICHEAEHRATMVPDLHKLNVPTDEFFWRTWISYGRSGSLMPAFAKTENGPLTDMQITSLATYLNMAIPSHITNLVR